MNLPALGLCPTCRRPVRLRVDGVTRHHRAPNGRICVQRRVDSVPVTFARWLYTQRTRRDASTNPITLLAEVEFGGPRHCGDRGPGDVTWTTADELHTVLHNRHGAGRSCDWLCDHVATAGAEYDRLAAKESA